MPVINQIAWSKVVIDEQKYWQALIIGDKVIPRAVEEIKKAHGTDHLVTKEEQALLLSGKPEVILIANGWSGVLKVDEKFKEQIAKLGIKLKIVLTPKIAKEYNQLIQAGKRVNALIHTTC
jgi:hypothetical protein